MKGGRGSRAFFAFVITDGKITHLVDGDHEISALKRMLIREEICFVAQKGERAMLDAPEPFRFIQAVRSHNLPA